MQVGHASVLIGCCRGTGVGLALILMLRNFRRHHWCKGRFRMCWTYRIRMWWTYNRISLDSFDWARSNFRTNY